MSVPLLVLSLLALVLWALDLGKASEIGKVIFCCAFLALCFGQGPASLHFK
jgi:hypothetical protein